MPYQFNKPEEIEGLDEPLIPAHLIPKGFLQEWEDGRYVLRKTHMNHHTRLPSTHLCINAPHFCNHFYDGRNGWLYKSPNEVDNYSNEEQKSTL